MIMISACLAGINCRYDGDDNLVKEILDIINKKECVLVCPEQLGGLATPRYPSEIKGVINGKKRVVNKKGLDVTENFYKGAYETLKIAELYKVDTAILKSRSPSCGFGKIYDGSFSSKLVRGNGITAELLKKKGIKIYTEESINTLMK